MDDFMVLGKDFLKKYRLEMYFLLTSIVILMIVVIMISKNGKDYSQDQDILFTSDTTPENKKETIFVDISGSVLSPNVYEISSGARLKDLLIKAGGLSAEADRVYFAQNYNLAQVLNDQEKIYIPSTTETKGNTFAKNEVLGSTSIQKNKKSISINDATLEELDTLPGIGKTTAQKIIDSRPYANIEELIQKKIVYKSVFADIREMISL